MANSEATSAATSAATTNLLTIRRLRETVAEAMATQRHAGGTGHVIIRQNASVLQRNGVYGYDLFDALEVTEGSRPDDFGGNECVSKTKARVEVIKALGKQAVVYDRTLTRPEERPD